MTLISYTGYIKLNAQLFFYRHYIDKITII